MRVLFIIGFLLFASINLFAQEDTVVKNGHQVFYHSNGKIASEGEMRDGKPDGYWKTYDDLGILKSEGNRKNFQLDSLWKFYDDEGALKLSITYSEGIKNGNRTTYLDDRILVDSFDNNIKNGHSKEILEFHFKGDRNFIQEQAIRRAIEMILNSEKEFFEFF